MTHPSMDPAATHLLSGLKCTCVTPALCALNVCTASLVRRSHSCAGAGALVHVGRRVGVGA